MTKIMEYKIVDTSERKELIEEVNGLILQGWRPYGIPFFIREDANVFSSWNQTMVRLSVKDEEGDEDESEELEDEVIYINANDFL